LVDQWATEECFAAPVLGAFSSGAWCSTGETGTAGDTGPGDSVETLQHDLERAFKEGLCVLSDLPGMLIAGKGHIQPE